MSHARDPKVQFLVEKAAEALQAELAASKSRVDGLTRIKSRAPRTNLYLDPSTVRGYASPMQLNAKLTITELPYRVNGRVFFPEGHDATFARRGITPPVDGHKNLENGMCVMAALLNKGDNETWHQVYTRLSGEDEEERKQFLDIGDPELVDLGKPEQQARATELVKRKVRDSQFRKRNFPRLKCESIARTGHVCCARCGRWQDPRTGEQMADRLFECDHSTAVALGGDDSDNNAQILCLLCHRDKTIEEDNPAIREHKKRKRDLGLEDKFPG